MAFDLSFNTAAFERVLDAAKKEFTGLTIEEVNAVAGEVLDVAKTLCPVEDGDLRDSGRIVKSRVKSADQHQVKIRFGNKKAPYAAYVELDPTDEHPVGQARFLTDAARQKTRDLPQRISTRVKGKRR